MKFQRFEINKLFGKFNHVIPFPISKQADAGPSLVILHGRNGIGKTTILAMLEGIMRLDFNMFRIIPFSKCILEFDTGDALIINSLGKNKLTGIDVTFQDLKVRLSPQHPGSLHKKDRDAVDKFRENFFLMTDQIAYELLDTARLQQRYPEKWGKDEPDEVVEYYTSDGHIYMHERQNPKAKSRPQPLSLASRVAKFVRDAQVNYRAFFSTTEPDVFPRMIDRLTSKVVKRHKMSDFQTRMSDIRDQDMVTERLGLEADRWDYDQLMKQIKVIGHWRGNARQQAFAVLEAYVEVLESRAAERALISDRLLTFERLVSEFFIDKKINVSPRKGININTETGVLLRENQLSSGEFHFLFLMVAALVAQRRGTVIAIDEPEMSMHIAWQRKLVPALIECAAGAEPLFIFATHSPDLATSYPDALIELKGDSTKR